MAEIAVRGGASGRLIASKDWAQTSLGPAEAWPQSLKTLVGALIGSPVALVLLWGPDGVMLYNDAYAAFAGARHPELLGGKVREGWPEVAAFNDHVMRVGLAGGALSYRDQELTLHRDGRPEQVWLDLDYSPVLDESGAPAGVLAVVTETTQRRALERARAFRQQLEEQLRLERDPLRIMEVAMRALAEHLDAAQAGFGDVDAAQERLTVLRDWSDGRMPSVVGVWRMDDFGPAFAAGMRDGLTTAIGDLSADRRTNAPEVAAAYASLGARSILDVPLIRHGRLAAILFVHDTKPRQWKAGEIALAEETSGRLWAAIERARAEAALRGSEARFRALVTTSSQTVYGMSADWSEMHHLERGEYLPNSLAPNRTWMEDNIPVEERPRVRAAIRDAIDAKSMFDLEHRISHGDGSTGWISSRAVPIVDAEGEIVEWFGAAMDVTARREAEERLTASEARLGSALTVARLGAFEWDLARDTVTLDGRACEIFSFPLGKPLTGEDIFARIDPAELPRVRREVETARREVRRLETEYRIQLPEGASRDVASISDAVADVDGRAERMIGVFADVTARKAAEERLRELNETLEQRVEERTSERNRVWAMSRDLLAVMGFDGRLVAINPAWEAVLGIPEERLLAMPFPEQVHPDDHAAVQAVVEQLKRGETITRFEDRLRHADGSWRWIAWGLVPGPEVFYAVGRDVTAEKEAAAELGRAQDALRQAQKLEAVGQLTGGVAHDFNNLLTVIRGSVELLMRPNVSEERRARYISAIADTTARATKLTSQLLAFARRQALRPEVFDVGQSVAAMTDMMATLTGARILLELQAPEEPLFINADPSQFDTAIVNLAVNARDAMDSEGRLALAIGAVKRVPPIRTHAAVDGDFVTISISDTGCGIPPDRLGQIFEPFFTTKGVGQGTGLGLSQVYGFVHQSGGAIGVESEVGQGTTFTLYLPRAAEPVAASDASVVAEPLIDGSGSCVLIVEDNVQVGEFATQTLRELGFATVLARTADEALDGLTAQADRFDIVFTDVVMPGMNGVDLAQEIGRRHPGLPVVLTSGYSHVLAENNTHGFELLQKPYSIEALSRVLRTASRRP